MNRFKIEEQIGQGAYSIVLRGLDRATDAQVAIKKVNHTSPEIKMVLHREIRILQRMNHKNIIRLLDIICEAGFTYLIFEYIPYDLITFYKDVRKNKGRLLTDS